MGIKTIKRESRRWWIENACWWIKNGDWCAIQGIIIRDAFKWAQVYNNPKLRENP